MRPLTATPPARTTLAVAFLLALQACDNNATRIYTARPYQVDTGCLDAYAPLAVVYADELPATCPPACLYFNGQLHVSGVCAPYPEGAELSDPGADADCAAALVALEQDLSCDAELPAEEVPSDAGVPPDSGFPDVEPSGEGGAPPQDAGAPPDSGASPDGG